MPQLVNNTDIGKTLMATHKVTCPACVSKTQHPLIICICRLSKQSARFQCDLAIPLWRFFIACNMQQASLGFNSRVGEVGWCWGERGWGGLWRVVLTKNNRAANSPKTGLYADVTLFWFGRAACNRTIKVTAAASRGRNLDPFVKVTGSAAVRAELLLLWKCHRQALKQIYRQQPRVHSAYNVMRRGLLPLTSCWERVSSLDLEPCYSA